MLTLIALGHTGARRGVGRVRLDPFDEYKVAITCLAQDCRHTRASVLFLLINGLGNIVVFMPLGVALNNAINESIAPALKRLAAITLLGAVLSLCYEIAQLWIPGRVTATDDVILNTSGAALGAALALGLRWRRLQQARSVT